MKPGKRPTLEEEINNKLVTGFNLKSFRNSAPNGEGITTVREFERFLVNHGFSRNKAKSICCKGFKNSPKYEIEQILLKNIELLEGI